MKKIEDVKILVVGDIMLDRYIIGDVERISPEAPVPVVNMNKQYSTLGGCGNVIRNLRSIGCQVSCVTKIGKDSGGEIISNALDDLNVDARLVVCFADEVTTIKTRIASSDRSIQLLRIDREVAIMHKPTEYMVLEQLSRLNNDFDIIIISDYAKGVITEKIVNKLKEMKIPIIADPKPKNRYLYHSIFMVTPNEKEYNEMNLSSDIPFAHNVEFILKTMGSKGIEVIRQNIGERTMIKSIPVDVYNVSGAGDTVVAVIAAAVSMGYDVITAAKIANWCAGYVITKPDTTAIPKEIFENACVNENI